MTPPSYVAWWGLMSTALMRVDLRSTRVVVKQRAWGTHTTSQKKTLDTLAIQENWHDTAMEEAL